VGLFDPGLAKDVDVHSMAEDESPAPVLAEARERLFLLVDGGHVPALLGKLEGHVRPHSAAADHERLHRVTLAQAGAPATSSASSSRTPCGKATTSTSHRAFLSTCSTVGEEKRDGRPHGGAEPTT